MRSLYQQQNSTADIFFGLACLFFTIALTCAFFAQVEFVLFYWFVGFLVTSALVLVTGIAIKDR